MSTLRAPSVPARAAGSPFSSSTNPRLDPAPIAASPGFLRAAPGRSNADGAAARAAPVTISYAAGSEPGGLAGRMRRSGSPFSARTAHRESLEGTDDKAPWRSYPAARDAGAAAPVIGWNPVTRVAHTPAPETRVASSSVSSAVSRA